MSNDVHTNNHNFNVFKWCNVSVDVISSVLHNTNFKRQNVGKAVPPVERLPRQCQKYIWKPQRKQWLYWCDLGLWGWSAGGRAQGDLGCFQSFLSEATSEKQTPSPTDLHERNEIWRSLGDCRLSLSWGSKCFPRKSGLIPCCCWRTSVEGLDRENRRKRERFWSWWKVSDSNTPTCHENHCKHSKIILQKQYNSLPWRERNFSYSY